MIVTINMLQEELDRLNCHSFDDLSQMIHMFQDNRLNIARILSTSHRPYIMDVELEMIGSQQWCTGGSYLLPVGDQNEWR